MTTKLLEQTIEQAIDTGIASGGSRSNYPGIPIEVVLGFCGPFKERESDRTPGWNRQAPASVTQRCLQTWRYQHAYLNMAIAKTREFEEARRSRYVSSEAAETTVMMRRLLFRKNELSAGIVDDMEEGERNALLKEIAKLGTELNRLDDLLTGKRDERIWLAKDTYKFVMAALNSVTLGTPYEHHYGGKTAAVNLPYTIQHVPGYTVPEGEVHLVWVTEQRGTARLTFQVHQVVWKERLDTWFDREPKEFAVQSQPWASVAPTNRPLENAVVDTAPPPVPTETLEQALARAAVVVGESAPKASPKTVVLDPDPLARVGIPGTVATPGADRVEVRVRPAPRVKRKGNPSALKARREKQAATKAAKPVPEAKLDAGGQSDPS